MWIGPSGHHLTGKVSLMRIYVTIFGVWLLGGAIVVHGAETSQEWKNFRGPGGQGMARGNNIPLIWSESQNISWKTKIPGRGFSAPVIHDDHVWLTTAFDIPSSPEEVTRRTRSCRQQPRHGIQIADCVLAVT